MLPSTVESRLVFSGGIAAVFTALTANLYTFPIIFAGLMLWATPSWDKYEDACFGKGSNSKLWGIATMGIRGLLLYPIFIELSFLGHPNAYIIGAASALQGVVYVLGGLYKPSPTGFAEYAWGAAIGIMMAGSITL
jgi:hypothetical protein